jgi:hypothetical protein
MEKFQIPWFSEKLARWNYCRCSLHTFLHNIHRPPTPSVSKSISFETDLAFLSVLSFESDNSPRCTLETENSKNPAGENSKK